MALLTCSSECLTLIQYYVIVKQVLLSAKQLAMAPNSQVLRLAYLFFQAQFEQMWKNIVHLTNAKGPE